MERVLSRDPNTKCFRGFGFIARDTAQVVDAAVTAHKATQGGWRTVELESTVSRKGSQRQTVYRSAEAAVKKTLKNSTFKSTLNSVGTEATDRSTEKAPLGKGRSGQAVRRGKPYQSRDGSHCL
ncbi:hypothetical protein H920_00664 [Fukomys damarensis]|uniref:RRM domain-containing protein n=1 Tax=Fukomys damarensis TaxID=885580 RepID=A0A091E3K3_FUKDA|nr:hypothetical protein H920_00664 [Fukomys damarensis]